VATTEPEAPVDDAPVEAPVPEEPAANVWEAIDRVIRDLPGIGKEGRAAADQGGYAYRGIEQITRHVQGLFARHGLVVKPRVLKWRRDEVIVGQNKAWHDERVKLMFRVVHGASLGGYESFDHAEDFAWTDVGPLWAIGRDGTDKGMNKAMTQGYKQMLLQLLMVSDQKDDNDGTTDEAYREQARPFIDEIQEEGLRRRLLRIAQALDGYPTAWKDAGMPMMKHLGTLYADAYDAACGILDAAETAIELGGEVLPPLTEAGGPGAAGEGEVPDVARDGEASTDAADSRVPADGENPAPPAEDPHIVAATRAQEALDAWLAEADRTDEDIQAAAQEARQDGDVGYLAALADLALDRGVDISPPSALDEG
jgi:hypothetical protein